MVLQEGGFLYPLVELQETAFCPGQDNLENERANHHSVIHFLPVHLLKMINLRTQHVTHYAADALVEQVLVVQLSHVGPALILLARSNPYPRFFQLHDDEAISTDDLAFAVVLRIGVETNRAIGQNDKVWSVETSSHF